MENEPSQVIDKLLYALFRDGSQSDSVLLQRSNHLATLVPGLMQQFLRDYEIDTNTIARQQQLLKSVAQNSTYVNSYLLDKYNNEGITPLYAWLASTTSDTTQMLNDSLSDNIINTALQYYGDAVASQEADQQQVDKSQAGIYAFANWWQGASDYITTISPDLLGSISYDSDPALAVNNYLNSSNGDINKVHEAVAASSDGAPNLQRLASLLQVNLSPANITSPYVDVLKTQQMRLAEQPIYGSSRVGVASYWPGQYDAVWDYTTGTQDTLRLLGIKPWYSATLEGYKPAGSTEPYDNSSLGLASAAHLLGQKNYELSNHLGNVQATLSDKRYVQKQFYTASDSLRKGYAASVSSLYDYYPFGMLMKERCTSDTATQSVYASQVVYSPQYTTVNNAMTGASITSLNTTTQTNYNGSVNYFGQSASISKTLSNLQSGIPVSMKINLLYTNKPLYLTLQQGSTLLYSTTMNSSGTYSFNFTPTQSMVQLSIAYSYFNTNANTLCFTLDSVNYTQQNGSTSSTQLVQISSKQSDKYRFGFNGQEKVNEIAGEGNHYTAEHWEYDSRIGRRWNVDPVEKHYESPYACCGNNPTWLIDPNGADTSKAHQEVMDASSKFSDPDASKVEWTTGDVVKWKCGGICGGGNDYLFKRKVQFTTHYRNVLKDAAAKYDIPEFLLAGVAFSEFGGDPMWIDDVADGVRSFDWSGPNWVDRNLTMTKDPNLTSFGNISIQVRRTAEELGYDVKNMSSAERNSLIASLKNPIQNIHITAKHLSTLKQIDFANKPTAQLTAEDIKVIATRYNRGPDISLEQVKKNMSYGNSIYKHQTEINNSLNPPAQR